MKYQLQVYSIWEYGQRVDADGRPHQEDSLYPPFGRQSASDRLFILCDGMGGHDAGEVASAAVCDAMSKSILADAHDADGIFTDADLLRAIDAAYAALDRLDTGASKKMGTTLTLLKLHSDGATIAHMGDSRVHHVRPGQTGSDTQILFVTDDHSLVNSLVKVGELTRAQARRSKQKNIITRAMQPGAANRCRADIYHTADIRPGDYFYLCSDGMLEDDEMDDGTILRRIFSGEVDSDDARVGILRGATAENKDNHTAIIVHVTAVFDEMPPKDSDTQSVPTAQHIPSPPTAQNAQRTQSHPSLQQSPGLQNAQQSPTPPPTPPQHKMLFILLSLAILIALTVGVVAWIKLSSHGDAKSDPTSPDSVHGTEAAATPPSPHARTFYM